jgi:predicted secreted hydrolase
VRFSRRALLLAAPAPQGAQADDDAVHEGRVWRWPRDHGAHPGARNEWWYATGWLDPPGGAPPIGFQVTFFRHRTGLASSLPGRFAARQLLFAHAALSDIAAQRHLQLQRLQRWSGDETARDGHAHRADTDVRLGAWWMRRSGDAPGGRYDSEVGGAHATFKLTLQMQATQPPLLQGHGGHSRKGPLPHQASHYYSLPHLSVRARIERASGAQQLSGHAWLDHEWSDEYLPPGAVGWDWLGINLDDGGALMAFRLRRADGGSLWSGGSHRTADGRVRVFEDGELVFTPQRSWASPATQARYPVQWQLASPAGTFGVRALMDGQELDGRSSNGAVYWEGLSDLLDARGQRIGRGYLEMTGYAKPLQM